MCIWDAGVWAPVAMLVAVCTLYLYKMIYTEAGTALPMK